MVKSLTKPGRNLGGHIGFMLVGISQKLLKKSECPTYIRQTDLKKKTQVWFHYCRTHHELHWLPIKQRIDYKILALVYKTLHGQAPSDVTDMLQITTRRQLRSSCSDGTTLVEPKTRYVTFGDRAFSEYAPRLWNRLPSHIKDSTFEQFKKLLKSHLFKMLTSSSFEFWRRWTFFLCIWR